MPITVELPAQVEVRLKEWARLASEPEADIVCRALESFRAIPPDLRDELAAWQQLGAEAVEKVAPIADETW